jgi:L-2-hydroxyglutarate oxidase LhgO
MHSDFLILGGGIIGLNVACELRRRYPDCRVSLLEKEPEMGQHASGRNSGVLHAGFYYTADSLKARFCRVGNRLLREWCIEHRLRLNACGKLVVARNESEWEGLEELKRRGDLNGVPLETITAAEAKQIEPRVKTHERALFSPNTATVSPLEVIASFRQEAERLGVRLHNNSPYVAKNGTQILTPQGAFEAGFVVNCAGLFADRIAHDFGFGTGYCILPFKGLYLYSDEPAGSFRTNIYPVPNLKNPFLGVHFTVTADGKAKIGPTAIPCFWREHYTGIEGFSWEDFWEIVGLEMQLFWRAGFDFRGLALQEIQKYSRTTLVTQAGELAMGIEEKHYTHWGVPGIRAQLVDLKKRTLVMDFLLEGDSRSLHVLNAVSPGFTCALPFAQYICDTIERAQ